MKRNKTKIMSIVRRKACFCLLFVLLLSSSSLCFLCAQTYQIWPEEISFNHDLNSNANDAVTIKENASTNISIPEYIKDTRNNKAAYIKSHSNNTIKVKFNSNASNVNFLIKATVISGTGIGDVCEVFVSSCDINSTEFIIELSGSTPGTVGINTFTWQWEATALPKTSSYCPVACATVNTTHSFYNLLATPQTPMDIAWTDVLDYACDWAYGTTSIETASSNITDALFNSGYKYETVSGTPNYGDTWAEFRLTDFLSDLGSNEEVNCLDMAKAVVTFANSLGADLTVSTWGFGGRFPLNCVDPIGSAEPTNNTFRSKLIDDDCRTGGFGYHAFAQNISDKVWDACLKYDIDSNPDNVSNSNPDCGNLDSGFSWIQPCNEIEVNYLARLVDDWTKYHIYSSNKDTRIIYVK